MGPRNTRKTLRGSHRGHEGHRGNIKVVRPRPIPNFTLSLKNRKNLRDLCVINSPGLCHPNTKSNKLPVQGPRAFGGHVHRDDSNRLFHASFEEILEKRKAGPRLPFLVTLTSNRTLS